MHLSPRARFCLLALALGAVALLGLSGCAEDQDTHAMQQLPWDRPIAGQGGLPDMGQQAPQF